MQKKEENAIPQPKYKEGYTAFELATFLSEKEFQQFGAWIYGQTCPIINGELLYYTEDVCRFLNMIRKGIPTYWD